MKRATGFLFAIAAAAALTLAFTTPAEAQPSGIAERTEAKVDQVLQLLQKLTVATPVTPTPPAPVEPVPPPPAPTPIAPATGGPSCNPGGAYLINGMGTVYNVCACPSATVQLRNMIPGNTISFEKMPGSGPRAIPLGIVTVSEGGREIGSSGSGGIWGIGLGDRAVTFTAQACTNLVVQVR